MDPLTYPFEETSFMDGPLLNKAAQKYDQSTSIWFERLQNSILKDQWINKQHIRPDFNNVGGKRASDESKGKKFRKCRKAPRYLA